MSGGSTQQFRVGFIANEALTGMRFVKLTTTSKKVDMGDTAGEHVIGAIDSDVAAGAHVSACVLGEVEVTSSEAIASGANVSSSANGRARTAIAGDYVVGEALTSCAGADEVVRVLVKGATSTSSTALPAAFAEGNTAGGVAVAVYDFAVDGGAISAISSGVTIPDNAIILDGIVDVITTCTTAGADAGTMAIHVQGAGDIVAAVAVSAATDWDAGLHDVIPANTAATAIKLTANRVITFTIATQAFTAGKFVVYLRYVLGA